MKFACLLLASMAAYSQAADDSAQRGLATLAEKWNITEPTFKYGALSFDLTFTVSDFVSTAPMADATLWDDGCKEGGNSIAAGVGAGIKSFDLITTGIEGAPLTGDNMDRDVSVNITLDSATISDNSLIYSEDTLGSQVTAEIRFCVRFGLKTLGPTSLEVNFLETLITLNVDLTDGFEIGSIAVEPKDKLVRTANQVYQVVGFRCDSDNKLISDLTPINQGSVVRVCVSPDAEATADGIKMRSIDLFTWSRTTPNAVTQAAIIARDTIAANQLTTYDLCRGDLVCSFESILFANFYTALGSVAGSGVASMQFGTNTSRRLRSGAGRNLQEDDEVAGASEFELDFSISSVDKVQGTSGANSMSLMAVGFLAVAGVAGLF
jgi:hypothetical protein